MENKNMTKEEKCANTQKGRIVISKGDFEKRVYEDELQSYLNDGWVRGIKESHRKTSSLKRKGKTAWNKGIPCREETKQKLSQSLKGRPTWSKGLTSKTSDSIRIRNERGNKTKLEKYGTLFPNNPMTEERKRKIGQANKGKPSKYKGKKRGKHSKEVTERMMEKSYQTKKKNNSLSQSNPEKQLYEDLKKKYKGKTIYRQYKDNERYPYRCDFYIVEDDLFIELNAHWSHGGHPFDPSNKEDIEKLKEWQEKAKVSKFYQDAILTWTIRDVEKQKCAKENNLNYITIY